MLTKIEIEKYFIAEKAESLVFLLIGFFGVAGGAICYFVVKSPFYEGAAIPLLVIGLLLAIIGFIIFRRSDADRIRNVYAFDMNPAELKETELPRMQAVMKNFILYRYIEMALVLVGILLFVYFKNNLLQTFWKGMGLSLAAMAIIALVADFFAEERGHIYLKGLRGFTNNTPR